MTNMELLTCPMCAFSVTPSDQYVLHLHFEQEHTEDSPFRIEDDPEPLPTAAQPDPSSHSMDEATPSVTATEKSVLCPDADCGELVLLSDFNDHLDLHTAATLSFDETTGKYHSQRPTNSSSSSSSSSSMHGYMNSTSAARGTRHGKQKEQSFLEQNLDTALPNALRREDDAGRKLKKKSRSRGDSSGSEKSTLSRSILSFNPFARGKSVRAPRNTARLGRAELGPHAWEVRMPKWLHQQLADGPKVTIVNRIGRDGRLIKQEQVQNETAGIIPILAQLSALDRSVKEAYYCHPSTLHIGKTPKEGGFCGYRNIQMLVSYIQGAHAQGYEEFPGRTPGILRLQDLIERAWDKGINEIGRQQTGGIRDTRKYIGTPEAQALFLSSEIDCAVELFTDSPDGQIEAHEQLLYAIESYFSQAAIKSDASNVYKTLLPPIYLQQPGHSITIVGFERRRDGSCNLMTLDPMYHTSPAMLSLLGRKNIRTSRPEVMQSYRRVAKQLRKHAAFEVLMLTGHPPLFPAWDVLYQFPDCRYLYAFFRSKTLGYDVYPEDHFLRNFPWQQYGGLWIVDDARFARSEAMNPLTAQALRRITGEGASPPSSTVFGSSSGSDSLDHSMCQLSAALQGMRSTPSSRLASYATFDGAQSAASLGVEGTNRMGQVLDMLGMHTTEQPKSGQPALRISIPQTKRCAGYPTPQSPTSAAKAQFPSPVSDMNYCSPVPQSGTHGILGRPHMCGNSTLSCSHGCETYGGSGGRLENNITMDSGLPRRVDSPYQEVEYVTHAKLGGISIASPPRSISSPDSPYNPASPRAAMMKNKFNKQALHNMSHSPASKASMPASSYYLPRGIVSASDSTPIDPPSTSSPLTPPRYSQHHSTPAPRPHRAVPNTPPTLHIANGIETSTISPISPTGTMLRYTSHRPVDSGLLALKALSESQVAEYRFWRPCGRCSCAFGCGERDEGEKEAARRLFRSEEAVRPDEGAGESGCVQRGRCGAGMADGEEETEPSCG